MYNKYNKKKIDDLKYDFNAVSIGAASPDHIRSWSFGEIKNPETVNYKSFKPEKGGLFCEKIFGPVKNWECGCGKYKGFKHEGHVCDRCGIEVINSKVRRERMGHIELAVPVSHIWFFKSIPSKFGLLLDISTKDLEKIIYYESWIVVDPKDTNLKKCQILSLQEYDDLLESNNLFIDAEIDIGAAAIYKLLKNIDLNVLKEELELKVNSTKSKIDKKRYIKKLKLINGFKNNNSKPEWMILSVLPVIPPDLRPLVALDGGRFATYDLNDFYRKVIHRNNRLKQFLKDSHKTPDIIIRNEKRMLQEAVDALLDNGRHGRVVTSASNRPLKSLSDMLKGKTGRFRQNLLGKRVDYSGRSVIVVGPELKLSQCGIPKKMALVLFESFVIGRLKKLGYASTIKNAKKVINKEENIVWDILEKITKDHPILLNRAPTLHRLSIQAFNPILIEGSAIRIHPLVCTAYNADFDGDQMAVHIPLSDVAKLETKLMVSSINNIFSPSNGSPITTPSQDIVLGAYYLTFADKNNNDNNIKKFVDYFELLNAYHFKYINIHDYVKIVNPNYGKKTIWGDSESKFITTTVGRCIFNEVWPDSLGFYNKTINNKILKKMINDCYLNAGHEATIIMLDKLKSLSYDYATKSGFSISIADLKIPNKKEKEIQKSRKEIVNIEKQYSNGKITEDERVNKVIDVWNKLSNNIANELISILSYGTVKIGEINPLFAMLDSGSRGSKDQIRQLAAMRGLMAKPSGEIIERPILSNFREGLNVAEYFISTHGARKGLADTALKTAESGYMTRKLIDVAQDVICVTEDCETFDGISVSSLMNDKDEIVNIKNRIIGRYTAKDIIIKGDDNQDMIIVKANEYITENIASLIVDSGINEVMIRSPLTCKCKFGICIKCYGKNLATNEIAKIGDSLGIIAAQSIGEPGTQLTMRTFHIGGTASSDLLKNNIISEYNGKINFSENLRTIYDEELNKNIVVKEGNLSIIDIDTDEELDKSVLYVGSELFFKHGENVAVGDKIAEWDPFNEPIISESSGRIEFRDLKEGKTLKVKKIKGSNLKEYIVTKSIKNDLNTPRIVIFDKDNKEKVLERHHISIGSLIMVSENEIIKKGKIIAKIPRQLVKNKDIIGGLPRISELFEVRKPKNIADISPISGKIEIGRSNKRNKISIKIIDKDNDDLYSELFIPLDKRIIVKTGDIVDKGQKITDGSISLQHLLEVSGIRAIERHIIDEIQTVYKSQGVEINDKHIEVIVKKMLNKVKIISVGSTDFISGEQVDKCIFEEENDRVQKENGIPASAEIVLLGITRASLETESFISAASFQDTTRILTDAATLGKIDNLSGFKENLISGHLIPVGTGSKIYSDLKLKKLSDKEYESEFK